MTAITIEDTGGLGPVEVEVAGGGGTVTPASRVTLRSVGRHRELLAGIGIDWGSGTGCLAIAAARVEGVRRVVAVERDPLAVASIGENARRNGVAGRIVAVRADVLRPLDPTGEDVLSSVRGEVGFVVANPPVSPDGDGLGFRRRLLAEALPYLVDGASLLIQISVQYGRSRIEGLADGPYRYEGMLETSPPEPFDLRRPDLRAALHRFVAEEARGGRAYEFRLQGSDRPVSAAESLRVWRTTGASPLTRWQVHHFRRRA